MASDIEVASKLISIHRKCIDNKLPFDLSYRRVKQLLNTKKCFYTGEELTDLTRSLDRIDPAQGYTEHNVVVAHTRFNMRKNNLTPLEVKQIYNGLKRKNFV